MARMKVVVYVFLAILRQDVMNVKLDLMIFGASCWHLSYIKARLGLHFRDDAYHRFVESV